MQISQLATALAMVATALADGVCYPNTVNYPHVGGCRFSPEGTQVIPGVNYFPCRQDSPCKKMYARCHLDETDRKHAKCHRQTNYPPSDA
ncbi:unnamed protein product [Zymoseptoria tritici ST99CH_1A5]|uniref:Uncharacterized protein n=3 Tax=Zymoseptoria tritici TaxID=1047171 RepID=A0A1X7RX31_ZYMT9|nr:unnamed protein product [Zymoseptoria tritici ST99CH_3D7]SMR54598.1 unnamed protein product [Zymoseptoria tritici ST99CH_1E4]SMR56454.1 unnamed protein product [Zymoseptoria tritici ST99CH_3D1]SMY25639.1 unnamed protein product [Zymoseptoria tritici ST99CH_1A5]